KSATQSWPLLPRAIPRAPVTTAKGVAVVGLAGGILKTLFTLAVHRLLSGPVVIPRGSEMPAMAYAVSVLGAAGGIFTTPPLWVTQRFLSGPVVMPLAPFAARSGGENSVTEP